MPEPTPTPTGTVRAWWDRLDDGWRATLLGWLVVVCVYLGQLL